MKNCLWGALFFVIFTGQMVPNSFALTLVSDIDDTLKIADVPNPIDAVFRLWGSQAIFNGMPELLNALPRGTRTVYLSGRPPILTQNTLEFIHTHQLPAGELIEKTPEDPKSLKDYKVKRLLMLLRETEDEFILIGDDTQSDPEAFSEVMAASPRQIRAAYIHVITGRKLVEGVTPYFMAFDLAEYWYQSRLLTLDQVSTVASAVRSRHEFSKTIAEFQLCPLLYLAPVRSRELMNLNQEVETMMSEECSKSPEQRETYRDARAF